MSMTRKGEKYIVDMGVAPKPRSRPSQAVERRENNGEA